MEKEKKEKVEKEDKEEIKGVVKEVVKEERKTHMWLITALVICLMVVCGAFGWLAGASFFAFSHSEGKEEIKEEKKETTDNNEEKKETTDNNEEKTNGSPIVAIGEPKKVGLFDEKFNLVWEYTANEYIPYGDVSADGEYLYFTDKDKLYRVNVETKETENLNLSLPEHWHFWVEGNQIVYDALFEVHTVNINNKTDEKLEILNENKGTVINGVYYYTKKDEESLCAYNISTKTNTVIDNQARITNVYGNSFLYVNKDNKYYLYNSKDDSKTFIMEGGQNAFISGINTTVALYNDEVYVIKENTLYTMKEDKPKEIYKFQLADDESITGLYPIGKNRFIVKKYIDNGPPCTSDVCGPTGDSVNYLFNLKKKELKDVNNEGWFISDSSVIEVLG